MAASCPCYIVDVSATFAYRNQWGADFIDELRSGDVVVVLKRMQDMDDLEMAQVVSRAGIHWMVAGYLKEMSE